MRKVRIGLTLLCLGFLNGCASITQAQHQSEALKQNCLNSSVLITDLTQPQTSQRFQLPDGKTCHRDFI